ncbi:hypothetical protein [Paenibacillus sp. V4I7]|uniref:hypothetical protein n=1 Tax=Paenibacillus sp. V4I7 TaxID=3042307 RepID=UPI0027820891|nr:hypothetical protein [Paenibacillus sp. V4I7]MDQ0899159.1 hypothetical protein [Paenibacillus sp. V4I7]
MKTSLKIGHYALEPIEQDLGHEIARLYRMLERDYFSASVGDEHDVFGQQRQHMIDLAREM